MRKKNFLQITNKIDNPEKMGSICIERLKQSQNLWNVVTQT
jgi:hypothetical protein